MARRGDVRRAEVCTARVGRRELPVARLPAQPDSSGGHVEGTVGEGFGNYGTGCI